MAGPWVAMLAIVSNLLISVAQGKQEGQAVPPPAANSAESEISMTGTDTAIKVQVNLVLVRVVVKDAGGKAVPGLKKEDFQLWDNGKQQRISAFNTEMAEAAVIEAAKAERKAAGTEAVKDSEDTPGPGVVQPLEMPRRFLALVFDDSHMRVAEAMAVHAATERLFASLTSTDRVAIYSTQGNVQQDYTGDAATIRKTLAAIVPQPAKGEGGYECPNVTYYQADLIQNKHDEDAMLVAVADATANNCRLNLRATVDRILQAGDSQTRETYQYLDDIVRKLASMPGQRVLVYVSPGFILGDALLSNSSDLIERAVRAGVVVNTIDARGLYTADQMPDITAPPQAGPWKHLEAGQLVPDPTMDYQGPEGTYRMQAQFESGQVLAGMAASTGGTYFHNRNDLDAAMSQALALPAVSYVLGFAPQVPMGDGKFHKLKVEVANGKKYQIQARNGYYAPKKSVDPEEAAKEEVREALFSRDEMVSVPVQLKAAFYKLDDMSAQLTVLTHLDISRIRLRKADGRSCNDVVLATGVFDTNGQLVDGEMKEITLKLKDSTMEKMSQTGLTIKTTFTVKPGTYVVRSVVRGSEGGQLTARNLTTVIP
ncbi:MAG TPA: VWA domain-containing protein [Candidatus Dormibacteraeota bacterium]|jgi:VWFA-related protein|nr:VWA domain-containing protein [Candidatus Dormibacteraeota bacterium]